MGVGKSSREGDVLSVSQNFVCRTSHPRATRVLFLVSRSVPGVGYVPERGTRGWVNRGR